jgi:hypothetical protein
MCLRCCVRENCTLTDSEVALIKNLVLLTVLLVIVVFYFVGVRVPSTD